MIEQLTDQIYIIRRKQDIIGEDPMYNITFFKVSEKLDADNIKYTLLEMQHSESESIREAIADAQYNGYETIFVSFDDIDFTGFYNQKLPILPDIKKKEWDILQFGRQKSKDGINKFVECVGIKSHAFQKISDFLLDKPLLGIVEKNEVKAISV